jgi:nucleoside-diphosphate-sugar epimerase
MARTSRAMTVRLVPFDAAEPAIAAATHILITIATDAGGDPVLNRYADVIAASPVLRWIGYLSSTVVHGDRGGAWVDEDTPPAPSQPRGQRRLDAELAWSRFAERHAVDIFRLAGIYGPGRSAFDDLLAGKARRMVKPGHQFGRIHRDDIGRAVAAAMRQVRPPGRRVLHLADDMPSESAVVVTEAARLMGVPPPPEIAFADAVATMSPMARGFWAENRKVASGKTQQALGLRWLYPSFREGLAAIWREESGHGSP